MPLQVGGGARVRAPALAGEVAQSSGDASCPATRAINCTVTRLSLAPPVQFRVNGSVTAVPGSRSVVIAMGAGMLAAPANGPTTEAAVSPAIE